MTSLQRTTAAQTVRTWAACAAVVGLALALGGSSADGAARTDAARVPTPSPAAAGATTPSAAAASMPASIPTAMPTAMPTATPPTRAPDRAPAAAAPAAPVGRRVPVRPARDAPAPPPPGPVRVELPALGIDMPVEPTGVDDTGRMALPDSADVAGWYRFGPAPLSPSGAAVVAAHVDDSDSVGPFARLVEADAGTAVLVTTADGSAHTYRVTEVRAQAKDALSSDALFDRSGGPRLVLVTCGGDWNPEAGSYTDNVMVTAVPEGR